MAAGFLKNKVMDNKEAIEILNIACGKIIYHNIQNGNEAKNEDVKKAFDFAISAIRDLEPNWNEAPKWANWFSISATGEKTWHEKQPEESRLDWYSSDGLYQNAINRGKLFKRPK